MSDAAKVINIEHDHPLPTDRILIDSQILVWLCYANSPKQRDKIDQVYEKYVKRACDAGVEFWHCPLQLSELGHTIERQERDIYASSSGKTPEQVPLKTFRYLPRQRKKVADLVEAAWGSVKELAPNCTEFVLTSDEVDKSLKRFEIERLDVYDLFFVEVMEQNGIPIILSADKDFVYATNIILLTANLDVIDLAKSENRLLNPRTFADQKNARPNDSV